MRAKYNIRNCCGDFVDSIEVEASGDFDKDTDSARCAEVCAIAGYDPRSRCDGCGSPRFHADFAEYIGCPVGEIYFNLADGTVSGDISGATRYDLIVSLEAILTELRKEDDPLKYIDFDEGKICTG